MSPLENNVTEKTFPGGKDVSENSGTPSHVNVT